MEIFELIISICTLGIALSALCIANKTMKADHERRKKQVTLKELNEIRTIHYNDFVEINKLLLKELNSLTNEQTQKLAKILGVIERFSVGVNTGVYDIQITNRVYGGFFITKYERFSEYIKKRRKTSGNFNLFSDFEKMYDDIKKIRKDPPKGGGIKNS
jgi:hypothetical protein